MDGNWLWIRNDLTSWTDVCVKTCQSSAHLKCSTPFERSVWRGSLFTIDSILLLNWSQFIPAICWGRCHAEALKPEIIFRTYLFLITINSICFPPSLIFDILNSGFFGHFLICVNSDSPHLVFDNSNARLGSLRKFLSVLNVLQHLDQVQHWWQCNILMSRLWRNHDKCVQHKTTDSWSGIFIFLTPLNKNTSARVCSAAGYGGSWHPQWAAGEAQHLPGQLQYCIR